jgi:hypothetical protein
VTKTVVRTQLSAPQPVKTVLIPGRERVVGGVPCYVEGGRVVLFDVTPGPKPPVTYCHLVPVSPASSADFVVVAADGTRGGVYGPVG